MNKKISMRLWAGALVCVLSLSLFMTACAKKNGTNIDSEPTRGTDKFTTLDSGETATFPTPQGFKDDCQCFFVFAQQKSETYAECAKKANGLDVTFPSNQTGDGQLVYRCGEDGPFAISKNIRLEKPGSSNAPVGGPAEDKGDETISAGGGSSPGPECLSDTDCPVGNTCQGGKCAAGVATPPTGATSTSTPTTGAPQELKVTLTARDESKTRLGLYTFSVHAEGGEGLKSVSVYGPFNRSEKHTKCDYEFGTWLVTLSAQNGGGDFAANDTSPAFQAAKGRTTGTLCQNAMDCPGYQPPTPAVPYCKIDLTDANGKPLALGDFASRLLVQTGKFVAVAEDDKGAVKTAELTLTAPKPTLDDVLVTVDKSKPQMDVSVSFSRSAALPQVAASGACVPVQNSPVRRDGSGIADYACPLAIDQQVQVTAVGLGAANIVQHGYQVTLKTPTIQFKGGGMCDTKPAATKMSDLTDCKTTGTADLTWNVERDCDITDLSTGQKTSCGPVRWVASVDVSDVSYMRHGVDTSDANHPKSNPPNRFVTLHEHVDVKSSADVDGTYRLKKPAVRDHDHFEYELKVTDLDGASYGPMTLKYLYQPFFKITAWDAPQQTWNRDDNMLHMQGGFYWEGQGLTGLYVNCQSKPNADMLSTNPGDQPTGRTYDVQPVAGKPGHYTFDSWYPSPLPFDWALEVDCTVMAWTYDGRLLAPELDPSVVVRGVQKDSPIIWRVANKNLQGGY